MQYTSRLEELEKNDNFSQPFIINLAALSENCKGEPFTVLPSAIPQSIGINFLILEFLLTENVEK